MSRLISMIRVAKEQLGLEEETYRDFLDNTIGKRSLKGSTAKELWRVVEELKRRGFVPRPVHKGKELVSDPQARLIRHLWLTMADCGIVRNRSEDALDAYVKRITGRGLEHATSKQRQVVIETLKRWLDRCEDAEMRAKCLAVLNGDPEAPSMINGIPVGVSYGGQQ